MSKSNGRRVGIGKKYRPGDILYNKSRDIYLLKRKRGLKVIPKVQIIRLVMDQQFPLLPCKTPFSITANSV
jgi:hypothetical protein